MQRQVDWTLYKLPCGQSQTGDCGWSIKRIRTVRKRLHNFSGGKYDISQCPRKRALRDAFHILCVSPSLQLPFNSLCPQTTSTKCLVKHKGIVHLSVWYYRLPKDGKLITILQNVQMVAAMVDESFGLDAIGRWLSGEKSLGDCQSITGIFSPIHAFLGMRSTGEQLIHKKEKVHSWKLRQQALCRCSTAVQTGPWLTCTRARILSRKSFQWVSGLLCLLWWLCRGAVDLLVRVLQDNHPGYDFAPRRWVEAVRK